MKSELQELCEELVREDYYDDYERYTKSVLKLTRVAEAMEQHLNMKILEDRLMETEFAKSTGISRIWSAEYVLSEVKRIINE